MIERLLQAQAALDKGLLDVAGRLYDQVAQADPRNAMALVGLARIALREDRVDDARELAEQALAIDPDEAAAQRLLREVYASARPAPAPAPPPEPASVAPPEPASVAPPAPAPEPSPTPSQPSATDQPAHGPSLLARLRRWLLARRGRG